MFLKFATVNAALLVYLFDGKLKRMKCRNSGIGTVTGNTGNETDFDRAAFPAAKQHHRSRGNGTKTDGQSGLLYRS